MAKEERERERESKRGFRRDKGQKIIAGMKMKIKYQENAHTHSEDEVDK